MATIREHKNVALLTINGVTTVHPTRGDAVKALNRLVPSAPLRIEQTNGCNAGLDSFKL